MDQNWLKRTTKSILNAYARRARSATGLILSIPKVHFLPSKILCGGFAPLVAILSLS